MRNVAAIKGTVGIVLGLIELCACAASHGPEDAPKPELSECASKWTTVVPLQSAFAAQPRVLRWQDGVLYYDQGTIDEKGYVPLRIMSVPDTGGTPTVLVEASLDGIWVEGDQVLYSNRDQLFSVPTVGGEPSLVSDGQMFGLEASQGRDLSIFDQALDDSYLYFELSERMYVNGSLGWAHSYEFSVWRTPRAGGPSERLATIPEDLGSNLALGEIVPLSDKLLLAAAIDKTSTLPKDGGSLRALPSSDKTAGYIGADHRGVLRSVLTDTKGYEILLSKPNGETPTVFWPDKPPELGAGHAWSDQDGRWIITGSEPFSDNQLRASVWSVSSHGHGVRLACDRFSGFSEGHVTTAALSPDAAYLVLQRLPDAMAKPGSAGPGWQIMKVSR